MRSASAGETPGRTIANSSPPNRAQVSSLRMQSRNRRATVLNRRSPAGCPRPSFDFLKSVGGETEQRTGAIRARLRDRDIEPLREQHAVGKLRQAVMMRQEFDAGFGLSPLGNVLIGANPAAIRQRLMIDRDQPPIAELLQKGALLAPIDELLSRQVDLIDIAARIISDGAAVGENIVQRHSRAQSRHRLIVDPAKLFVDQLKPVLGIVQAEARGHVGDALLETLRKRPRAREAPRQVMTDRSERLRKSAARVQRRLAVSGSTRHGPTPR